MPILRVLRLRWVPPLYSAFQQKSRRAEEQKSRRAEEQRTLDQFLAEKRNATIGKAEIRDTDIWEETGKILTKYGGKEGGADYLEQLKKQPRVLVVLKPSRMEIRGLVKQGK